jgi:thiol-disulfide isomerase/thioredoxin
MPIHLRWAGICLAASVLLVLAGCRERPAAPAGDRGVDLEKVNVQVIDENGLAAALAERRGKVVLVDFWATWCTPCRELFPHTVQLYRDLAGKGFDVVSVSLDDPDREPAVLQFLVSQRAEFANCISRYGTSPKSMEAFGISDGSLPLLKLYDREGNLSRTFNAGEFKAADVDRAVQELLARR